MMGDKQIVSYQEQVEAGLIRKPSKLVVPQPAAPVVRRMPAGELNTVSHTLDVAPSATHYVEMKTSAVDRSKGFLIATVPLSGGFALGVLLVAVFFWSVPLFSLPALVVFWLSFVAAWLFAYLWMLLVSAEGIALFEAWSKWNVIKREQSERWDYYKHRDE